MRTALFFAGLLLFASLAQAEDVSPGRTITVRGDAEVKRAPDKAEISIGIQEQRRNLKEAQKATDEQLKALYSIAKEMGVEQKDMRTEYSSVQPIYNYEEARQVFSGYTVNHQISVTLRDIDKIADFTQKLMDSKIDQINNIMFGLQKEDEARDEALKLALEKARAKAMMLARVSGETLGKVYSINESGVQFQPMPVSMMRGKAMMAMEGAAPAMDMAAPPSGEMTIHADVQATFLLKD